MNIIRPPRVGRPNPGSDHAEQPKDEDQDQDTAKTNIHDTLLCLVLRIQTASVAVTFQSLRYRHELPLGIILPFWKVPDLLDFLSSRRK